MSWLPVSLTGGETFDVAEKLISENHGVAYFGGKRK